MMLARDDQSPLKRTPLYALHVASGGKMVPFAGYDMPVQYTTGVLREHLHTRLNAGLFDVSHMGQIVLRPKSGKLEDAALAMASVYRSVGLPLPTAMPMATNATLRAFAALVAQFMPFDLVIDEETADGQPARVSRSSVCGSWGAVAGSLRYFADRWGIPRAAIEGTQIPMEMIRRYATRGKVEVVYDPRRKHGPLMLKRTVEYFGFELESEAHR